MKEVKAYIRNQMVDHVVDALKGLPQVPGVAIVPVTGFGHARGGDGFESVEMTKLEIDVADDAVESVLECIVRHAQTGRGHFGDGKITVTTLDDAVRIMDGVRGGDVLGREPLHNVDAGGRDG